eukprot:scaffold23502_cov117-Skeletonema_marinoi.AAC.1
MMPISLLSSKIRLEGKIRQKTHLTYAHVDLRLEMMDGLATVTSIPDRTWILDRRVSSASTGPRFLLVCIALRGY